MATRRPVKQITRREIAAIHSFYAPAFGREAPEIPKARAPSRDLEHPEQVKIIKWWKIACASFGLPEFALFAIPNAGQGRSEISGSRLKEEGVRAGVSDLFLAAPVGRWHGLFYEVKSSIGKLSVPQSTFLYAMEMEGYRAECGYSGEEAIEFIKSYLRG